jgi:hypothetical protein
MTEQRESLESLLSKAPHIDDNGFTQTLMTRLPARRPSLRMRALILLASTLTSCCIVMAVPGARRFLTETCIGILSGSAAVGSNLLAAGIVIGLAAWGALAAAASDA